MGAVVVGLEWRTHGHRALRAVWAHAGMAGTVLAHNRKGPLASPLLALCVASLPSSHRDTRYVTSHALAKHGSPKLMLLHPILGDPPSYPRAIGCLYSLQVLTEAAMSPRLPLVSCLSVRLSLRTERFQEASFLPPPLLASTHAHPTAGCPSVPAASCHQGSGASFLCPLKSKRLLSRHLLDAKVLGRGKG